jgi:hypothetical protein
MKRELTKQEINRLYQYVNDKGVKYFDVQVELVDHIASKIEDQLDQLPDKPVDEVFQQTLKRFKKREFKQVVKEKEKQVRRQYRHYFWQNFKSFFSWPKVFFTAVLTWILFVFLQRVDESTLLRINDSIVLPTLGIGFIYGMFLFFRHLNMPRKLSFTAYTSSGGAGLINAHFALKAIIKYTLLDGAHYPVVAAFLLVLLLFMMVAALQAHEKLVSYGRHLYPQAFA